MRKKEIAKRRKEIVDAFFAAALDGNGESGVLRRSIVLAFVSGVDAMYEACMSKDARCPAIAERRFAAMRDGRRCSSERAEEAEE